MPVQLSESSRRIGESIVAKLKGRYAARKIHFDHIIRAYALEGVMRRVSHSRHLDALIAKGSCVFHINEGTLIRPTIDVDFGSPKTRDDIPDTKALETIVREILATPLENDDGLAFDIDTLHFKVVRERDLGVGAKVVVNAHINTARQPVGIDLQAGAIHVDYLPDFRTIPTLLPTSEAPVLRVYPLAHNFAEKLNAAATFGTENSRFKDTWDMARRIGDVSPEELADAIEAVFPAYGRPLPSSVDEFEGLSHEFAVEAQAHYDRWVAKMTLPATSLADACAAIRAGLEPAISIINVRRNTPSP